MKINYKKAKRKNKFLKKSKKKSFKIIYFTKIFFIFFFIINIYIFSFNLINHYHKLQNNQSEFKKYNFIQEIQENKTKNETPKFQYQENKTTNEDTKFQYHENKTKNESTKFQYFCCFCSMGKKENLYSRELISYYMGLGVEKFVFGDNNLPNTEKFEDVLQDYIKNGTVDILNIIGSSIGQGEFCGIMYEKYKEKCEWLTFFDFDEYLEMHFEEGKNISLKEYLTNSLFKNCEAIEINWLMHGDNDLVYYDNRPLIERFTKPDFNHRANRFVKSIIRGNLSKKVFIPGKTHHQPSREVIACNSLGEPANYYPDCIIPPRFKYAYLKHFNTKTAEEYVEKIKRGHPGGNSLIVTDRVDSFFQQNNFSEEKLKIFETKFNQIFPKYHHN